MKSALSCLLVVVALTGSVALAQPAADSDSARTKDAPLDEVVVTATRSTQTLADLPVPMTVVDGVQIQAIGAPRLTEVLEEQLGVTITSSAISQRPTLQLQGLSSEYVLILVDGEPLIGREAGALDLDRLAIAPIERVEIVKGAVSSLYGSDALGGVVNIITKQAPEGTSLDSRLRYGSNDTWDASLSGGYRAGGFSTTVMGNYYRTAGFFGQAPNESWTTATRTSWVAGSNLRLGLTARYARQVFFEDNATTLTAEQSEYGLIPTATYYGSNLKLHARYYEGRYNASDPEIINEADAGTRFDQTFRRPEAVFTWNPGNDLEVISGLGGIYESLERSLFQSRRFQQTQYVFGQATYRLRTVTLLAGARYDHHSVYGASFNPKGGVQWQVGTGRLRLRVNGSVGTGFKAPDFRQLYFNFINPAGGAYTVAGTEELDNVINRFLAEGYAVGFVGSYTPETLRDLRPERGTSYQLGTTLEMGPQLSWMVNGFWHAIRDRIETVLVANRALDGNFSQGPAIFSYVNIDEIVSRGFETEVAWTPSPNWRISAGYLLLDAYDPNVRQALRDGNTALSFRVDPATGRRVRVRESDYGGLFNRSRHSGNVKVSYLYPRWGLTLSGRLIARGEYGQQDRNGNDILDLDSEYAPGYVLGNFSARKTFGKVLAVQAGLDNAFNFTDPDAAPHLAGRLWFVALDFSLRSVKP